MLVHLFHCPSCGAPLSPRGNGSVINCSYCRSSVVAPESLRQGSDVASWPTLVFDNFTSNENNWLVGSFPSHYFAALEQVIAGGRYRWEAKVSLASTITTAWLRNFHVADFHLTANSKHISGSAAGSSCGVIFRIQDNHNFYWFHVADSQQFAVSLHKAGQWRQLVDWTRTRAVKPNGVNQMEVIARASHFTFLINGQTVSEVEDEQFGQGLVGLAIEAYIPGETIAYEYMDLVLRAP